MIDRASTFADPEIVEMLKNDFIPVAIDQWYQRKEQDAEGEFYRKIASQGPRNDFKSTTQGRYICTADGKLLGFNNNRGPERIRKLMKEALANFDPADFASVKPIESGKVDPRYERAPPENGLMLRVNSKVLGGYEPTNDWTQVFQESIGRDNAWFQEIEKNELVDWIKHSGSMPEKLAQRIARFHLIDNTRGEPPRWSKDEIKSLEISIQKNGTIKGSVHLETADGQRGYQANLRGQAELVDTEIKQFDLVARGEFWGVGPHTHHGPKGKFPLAIAFRIADGSDPSDLILPHGGKGWLQGYYE